MSTLSAEHRAQIAERMRGNRHGAGNAGMVRTPEGRQRMSAARRAGSEARKPLSYTAVHKRLRKDRGTPSLCEHCGTTNAKKFEWAYAGEGHEHGAWSADLAEYIRLCTRCRIAFDRNRPSPSGRR